MKTIACFKCAKTWVFAPPLGRGDECPACRWDAHVCLNCLHYEKNAHHECREPQAEYVQNKERSNFCDYFEAISTRSQLGLDIASHKDKLEQLFSNAGQKLDDSSDSQPKSLHDELQEFLKKR
jgi:hypothetical protein